MTRVRDVLVVGAGPFGLGLAALAVLVLGGRRLMAGRQPHARGAA